MIVTSTDVQSIVDGGGTLALALVVWFELRAVRGRLDQLVDAIRGTPVRRRA